MADVVLYEVSDGVATATINRPERMDVIEERKALAD